MADFLAFPSFLMSFACVHNEIMRMYSIGLHHCIWIHVQRGLSWKLAVAPSLYILKLRFFR